MAGGVLLLGPWAEAPGVVVPEGLLLEAGWAAPEAACVSHFSCSAIRSPSWRQPVSDGALVFSCPSLHNVHSSLRKILIKEIV